ncbi:MAG: hypothetical protein ABIL44_05760 [candidate division WOR-3 bacterium]
MSRTSVLNKNVIEKLNQMIEQKIFEILGDPDYGLELRDDFKAEIIRRLKRRKKHLSHREVVKRFG